MNKYTSRRETMPRFTPGCFFAALLVFSLLAGCAGFGTKSAGNTSLDGEKSLRPEREAAGKIGNQADNTGDGKNDPELLMYGLGDDKADIPLLDGMRKNGDNGASTPKSLIKDRIQARFDKSLEFYQTAMEFWQQGELENALDALDNGYALIINTETGDDPKFIQQKDDLRFMISKRILEIYASRHTTVKGNHNAIPIEINDYVQKEIDFLTTGKARQFFINSYKRAGRYRPHITKELRDAGLPEELSWLPLVESGFRVNALSHARALGMWQFIASTGYKFGLKRDAYVDERLDPYKSTRAAIEYLQELHDIFGDWKTVLAAYNCGEGRVLREIRKQNVNYLDDFWDLYERLPRETAQYVPRFLATLHILNNLEKYDMADIEANEPFVYETLAVSKQARLKDVAAAIGTTEAELVLLNPELRYKLLPDEEYTLKVPAGKKEILLSKIDEISEYQRGPQRVSQHRVRRGETLSEIAARYGTTVSEIARFNNIYRDNYIVAGQVLKIPRAGALSSGSAGETVITYSVRRGDSLWLLANRYNTTTKKIQDLNNLKTVNLHIGQKLKIPTGASRNGLKIYKVRQGDSPYSIARRHNMSVNEFLSINQLSKNARIYPDQELLVK